MTLEQKLQKILNDSVASGEECGCQLAVYRHGEQLFSLCAGNIGTDNGRKVDKNTLVPVFSVSKGIVTTMLHILAEKGKLSYDDKVTKFWPEYGCCGKEITTVKDVMTHRAGLFNLPKKLSQEECFHWETITAAMAAAEPEDRIGGIHHYHAYTYGVLAGAIAEKADGRPFRQILQEEILEPLNIDTMFFGLPAERHSNLAILDGSVFSDGRLGHNNPAILSGLNPSSNGCMNAEAIAKVYASLIGSGIDGVRLLSGDTVEKATVLMRSEDDPLIFEKWDKFGLGYALCGPRENLGRMFGHGGACGSEGFADKETGYAIGFTKNRLNATHPAHPTRNAISEALGLPERIW